MSDMSSQVRIPARLLSSFSFQNSFPSLILHCELCGASLDLSACSTPTRVYLHALLLGIPPSYAASTVSRHFGAETKTHATSLHRTRRSFCNKRQKYLAIDFDLPYFSFSYTLSVVEALMPEQLLMKAMVKDRVAGPSICSSSAKGIDMANCKEVRGGSLCL